jgi:tetratricopeptide (TPR) repeat protein
VGTQATKIDNNRMIFAAVFILSFFLPLQAEDLPALSKGYQDFYNLEYDQAIDEFSREISANPDDAAAYNHLAQAILYREMFRAGALESELVSGRNPFLRRPKMNPSPEDQKEFEECIQKAIQLSERRIEKNSDDTQALYTLGVSYGLRANYNFLVNKAWFDALRDATKARKLHNKVSELDPSIVDARLVQGAHDYVVGSLPWHIKLLGFLVGFRGDKEGGIRTVELVAQKGKVNRFDAQILLCAVYRREREPAKAVPLLENLIERFPRNYLFRFELAQMYSDLGNKTNALAAVQKIEELKAANTSGYSRLPKEKIYYSRGTIQFWYNDLDQALDNMRKVTAQAEELDLNTATFAWLRLGQIYDLKGARELAVKAYQQAINLAPTSDAAKLSRDYLSAPYRRERKRS